MKTAIRAFLAVSLALGFHASTEPASARDSNDALAKAKQLMQDGEFDKAVEASGSVLARAQKKKDVLTQLEVLDVLGHEKISAKLHQDSERNKLMGLLLSKLDAKHASAVCPAGQVGHALLLLASRTGDWSHVKAAAAAAKKYASQKTGQHAKVMATYGEALVAIADGKAAAAVEPLRKVVEAANQEGWGHTAVHAVTELAAAHLAGEDAPAAARAMELGKLALDKSKETYVVNAWKRLVAARLADAPENVLAPYTEAVAPEGGGRSVSAAGGRGGKGGAGGKGGRGGQRSESPLGKAWKRLSKKKPFVTAERTETGFAVGQSFDQDYEGKQSFESGVKLLDNGGVTLAFFGRGVRVAMLDLTGLRGQPGDSSEPGPFEFFTPLAKGETWGIAKSGVISVR